MSAQWVWINGAIFETDTVAEIEVAEVALRDAGQARARVMSGDPDGPDSVETSLVLYAAEEDEEMNAEYRAYDTTTEWLGRPRATQAEAERDCAAHNRGCAKQGGYGSAVVVTERDGRCVDLDGADVWPPHGRGCGAARWR